MNRRAHSFGRGLTCLGLLATGAYLGWRLWTLPSDAPIWLVVVAFVVEVAGFVGSGLLMWALWHGVTSRTATGENTPDLIPVDVAIRVVEQPLHQIRATLLSLQTMPAQRTVLVDRQAVPPGGEVHAVRTEVHQHRVLVVQPEPLAESEVARGEVVPAQGVQVHDEHTGIDRPAPEGVHPAHRPTQRSGLVLG